MKAFQRFSGALPLERPSQPIPALTPEFLLGKAAPDCEKLPP